MPEDENMITMPDERQQLTQQDLFGGWHDSATHVRPPYEPPLLAHYRERIQKLSKRQRTVLAAIAIRPGTNAYHPATLKVLMREGFIEPYQQGESWGSLGIVTYTLYRVTSSVIRIALQSFDTN